LHVETHPRRRFRIAARDHVLDLGPRTLVMGVLNVTPDSFSDGGAFRELPAAIAHAWALAEAGADILDVGAESTRPGAASVPLQEELDRLLPVLEGLAGYPLPISVDTRKPETARAALELGASLINDVGGLRDGRMAAETARSGAAAVLVHMRGEPATMQRLPPSPDILAEIESWQEEAVARAESFGVSSAKLILDPGIGFGKTVEQNIAILRNLGRLAQSGFPLLVGTSRKSFIGKLVNRPGADRIWGTAATVAAAVLLGAHIVRVHDVREMRDVVRVADAVAASEEPFP
jgi:dihydropteroate synthase